MAMPALLRRCLAVLLVLVIATVARAQDQPPIARVVPPGPDPAHVFVLDSAHILSPAMIAALQDSARALQTETQADVAWVTLPTLGGRAIEEAALYIGRTWRIGSAGKPGDPLRNRGLVILFIPDKKTTAGSNFRIEVGNGLEGTITDSRSRSISAAMRESLKAKHYDTAYLAGWTIAASLVREDFASHGVAAPPPPVPNGVAVEESHVLGGLIVTFVFIGLAILFVLLLVSMRRGARRPAGFIAPLVGDDNDDDARRRGSWASFDSGSSSSSDSSSSSSDGGSFGDGGGFSGGGSSDTI